jgi:hypothetical protein
VKIEYLAEACTECPLIRLYRFDLTEVQELQQLVKQLSTSSLHEVSLKDKSWVESVGGCGITLRLGERDEGIRQCGPLNFECVLTSDGWNNVQGLLEPFCESNATGYQWLINTSKISLLLSHDGQW